MFDVLIESEDYPKLKRMQFEGKPVSIGDMKYAIVNIIPLGGNHYEVDLSKISDYSKTVSVKSNEKWLKKISSKFLNHKGKQLAGLYKQLDEIKEQIKELEEK